MSKLVIDMGNPGVPIPVPRKNPYPGQGYGNPTDKPAGIGKKPIWDDRSLAWKASCFTISVTTNLPSIIFMSKQCFINGYFMWISVSNEHAL
jgi:hypothetical protein